MGGQQSWAWVVYEEAAYTYIQKRGTVAGLTKTMSVDSVPHTFTQPCTSPSHLCNKHMHITN